MKVNELSKALNKAKDVMMRSSYYQNILIGTEVRNQRLIRGLTLAELASKRCSTSYICKMETHQIIPSIEILNDVCKSLNITQESKDALLNSGQKLDLIVQAYCSGDGITVKRIANQFIGLTNYRAVLINFISHVYHKDLYNAAICVKTLSKLIGSIDYYDLLIFNLVYSRFCFLDNDLSKSYRILKLINKSDINFCAKGYILKQEMILLYLMNKPGFYSAYDNYVKSLIVNREYQKIEEADYIKCQYLLYNDDLAEYGNVYQKIKSKKYKQSLNGLFSIIYDKELTINVSDAESYVKNLLILLNKTDQYQLEFKNDLEYNYFPEAVEMFMIKDEMERLEYASNLILRGAYDYCNKIAGFVILKEVRRLCTKFTKYKLYLEIDEKLRGYTI